MATRRAWLCQGATAWGAWWLGARSGKAQGTRPVRCIKGLDQVPQDRKRAWLARDLPLFRSHDIPGESTALIAVWNGRPPEGARVDIVLYLHGWSSRQGTAFRLEAMVPDSGHAQLPPLADGSGRAILALLPRGKSKPAPEGGKWAYDYPAITDASGGLDRLIGLGLGAMQESLGLQQPLRRGGLVLTAHSAGCARAAALLNSGQVGGAQVFLHDGVYERTGEQVANWLVARKPRLDPSDALCITAGSATLSDVEKVFGPGGRRRAALADLPENRFRIVRTQLAHGEIPAAYNWRLIEAADSPLTLDQRCP